MFVLAFGAWAGDVGELSEVYTYTLAINKFKYESVHGLPADTVMKLVDKNTGMVLASLGVNQLSLEQQKLAVEVHQNHALAESFTAHWGGGPDNMYHEGYYLTMELGELRFPSGIYAYYLDDDHAYVSGGHTYLSYFVIDVSSASSGLSQISIEKAANGSTLSSVTVYNPVPEPTSGLLLLLGVAGLALKRKKAA